MSATLKFVTFLSFAIMVAPHGEADHRLPAPQNCTPHWADRFVVEVKWIWLKPNDLPESCKVEFEIRWTDKQEDVARVKHTNFTYYYLSKDFTANILELSISSKPLKDCNGWNESDPVKVNIKAPKSYAELVKDFRCFYLSNGSKCFWTPVDPSEDLKVYYRSRGKEKKDIQSLKVCEAFKMEGRNSCSLKLEKRRNIFVLVENETRMNTFEPKMEIYVPKMSINETEKYLHLTWRKPAVGPDGAWRFCVWYKECGNNKPPRCYEFSQRRTVSIPYNKCCRYEFQYNISTNKFNEDLSSDTSEVILHGTTSFCISSANVVAIIIPIIVCFCVILSIYCFKKHEKIFGCTRLDPSVIKEILNLKQVNKISQENQCAQDPREHTDTCTPLVPEKEK
ncbi:uncharacterized protein LOC103140603 isoform X1 [Poecilia formosa]|uniref:uncharacterized protein LOC103140603 isoform X1 n=1 Tax=Poecilia formosa TaxID=48698 RepID=UPI0007BA1EA0|nr:PREDICTED: uncharacterized protein LOC103140603 isoform X1 [Poecilia formosa]